MPNHLDDYYAPIGKLTIGAAALEDTVIRWGALLSEDVMKKTHAHNLRRGFENNLDFLIERVKERVSAEQQQPLVELIEKARSLKDERNKNVHGTWAQMVHADNGEFAQVMRSRYEKGKGLDVIAWDVTTPGIAELEKLAVDLNQITEQLEDKMSNLWNNDAEIVHWRIQRANVAS